MTELISKTTIDQLRDAILKRKETIAVAESVTSGILQAAISAATEAASFFQGGITAYNLGQKVRHLDVEPIHAEQCNCVSEQTASQMALGVTELFRSDWGVGITGYATPVPEAGNKLFAHWAISYKDAVLQQGKIVPVPGEYFPVQLEYAVTVIEKLIECISHQK